MSSKYEAHNLEAGNLRGSGREFKLGNTAHSLSASSLRKKSDLSLVSKLRNDILWQLLTNLQVVLLGTKLAILFPAIPFAVVAQYHHFGGPWVFALSMLGLIPLAERLSFLTEQIALCTCPTVGGLLNATCGNATELIIALFALYNGKINVVKYSLLGSILSNLLLVLGSSLFCGGLANLSKEQKYDRKQVDVTLALLFVGLICLMLPLMIRYSVPDVSQATRPILQLSRASSIVMVFTYLAYLFFQLKTHRQVFESDEEEDESDATRSEDKPVVGFVSSLAWLMGMTAVVAVLSEYLVGTIEDASDSWGISVSFISIILLPIVGNATEHAGAIIFALRNKLEISLGVALGSSTQIAMFVVPVCVIVAWIMGKGLDLNFHLLETGSLCLSIVLTAITLQDGTSHYMKGLVLLLAYIFIAACFFVMKLQINDTSVINSHMKTPSGVSLAT